MSPIFFILFIFFLRFLNAKSFLSFCDIFLQRIFHVFRKWKERVSVQIKSKAWEAIHQEKRPPGKNLCSDFNKLWVIVMFATKWFLQSVTLSVTGRSKYFCFGKGGSCFYTGSRLVLGRCFQLQKRWTSGVVRVTCVFWSSGRKTCFPSVYNKEILSFVDLVACVAELGLVLDFVLIKSWKNVDLGTNCCYF